MEFKKYLKKNFDDLAIVSSLGRLMLAESPGELEESDYDRYLYASGRPNRLEAGEVLAGGSANHAGLRKGDVILRYDDVRIFGPGDLLVTSSRGEGGSSVRMEILREGRRRTLYIDRGPLGALMNHNRALPLED